jgi:hypothetical protein
MKRLTVGVAVVLAATISMGCGKLSKDDARVKLQAKYYETDDAYCTWDGGNLGDRSKREPKSRTFSFVSESKEDLIDKDCVEEMVAVGMLKKKGEPIDLWKVHMGSGYSYVYGLADSVEITRTGDIRFPCGKVKLDGVTSISTEGKKATVTYVETITRNDEQMKKLAACRKVDGATSGTKERTWEFLQDDDGKWSPR